MPQQGQIQYNGSFKRVWNNGKWEAVDKIENHPSGAQRAVTADGFVAVEEAPQLTRVEETAAAFDATVAQPELPEGAGFWDKIAHYSGNQPMGAKGDVAAMRAASSPEAKAYDLAKTDEMYNIKIGDISMAESDALPEASHTSGYSQDPETGAFGEFMGDMGAGSARAFLYDEDYATILSSRNPGSHIIRDPENNLIIKYQDGTMERINKKGFSPTDALQIPGEIATYAGVGAVYRKGAKETAKPFIQDLVKGSLVKNAAREGGKAAGFSAAKDLIGSAAATGELDIDIGRSLTEGGFGALIQPGIDLGVGGYSKFSQKIKQSTKVQGQFDSAMDAGEMTTGVREGLEKAGYNMDQQFTPEQVIEMNNYHMANPHLPADELGRGAYAVATGQIPTNAFISQDPGLQLDEGNILKRGEASGLKPVAGSENILDAPQTYNEMILDPRRARTEGAIEDIGRPDDLVAVQESIAGQRADEIAPLDKSFKDTRAEAMNMELTRSKKMDSVIDDLNTNIFDEIRASHGLTEAELPVLVKGRIAPDGTPRRVTFGDILSYRDTISGLTGVSPAKKSSAIRALMESIDEGLEDAIWATDVPGVFNINHGERAFVEEWRKTIDEYGATKAKWNSEKFVTRALTVLDDGTYKYDGKQIADNLFGGINGKFLGRSEARRAVTDLQAQLPDDMWKQVQAELKYRLMGLDKYDANIGTITGAHKNAKQFNEFIEDHPDLALDIFGSAEELAQSQNFIKQMDLEYLDPRRGAVGTSNTALGVGSAMDRGISKGKEIRGVGKLIGGLEWLTNPEGALQKNTRASILDNVKRAQKYTGRAPQVGGLLGLMASDEDADFEIPYR